MTTETTPEVPDTRTDGPMTGTSAEVLHHFLDLYREAVLIKIGGLDPEQLCARSVPPSTMSPIGLVRHLTEVEAYWIKEVIQGVSLPDYYCTEASRDGDFDDIDPSTAMADVAAYRREVSECRDILNGWPELQAVARGRRRGKEVNVGWILAHLVEEYARHLGHLDLLREAIDGRTGY